MGVEKGRWREEEKEGDGGKEEGRDGQTDEQTNRHRQAGMRAGIQIYRRMRITRG